MHIETLRCVLLGCTVINYGVLLVWFLAFLWLHEGLYRLHSRWFRLSVERFDLFHYFGMGIYKIGILLFNLVPWVVLWLLKVHA